MRAQLGQQPAACSPAGADAAPGELARARRGRRRLSPRGATLPAPITIIIFAAAWRPRTVEVAQLLLALLQLDHLVVHLPDGALQLAHLHGQRVEVLLLGDRVPVRRCDARLPVQLELGVEGCLDVCARQGSGGRSDPGCAQQSRACVAWPPRPRLARGWPGGRAQPACLLLCVPGPHLPP
jgi:hypothetical protein